VSETRKLAAILVSDIAGYSRLAGSDEDRILARLRTLRSDLIDPTIAVHHGRVVKRTGDGSVVEFRSVVDAVRCAIEVQSGLIERNAGLPDDKRIQFRVGIHVGDIVEESDGDLMGDGVNIAARLEGVAKPGAICLSEQAYWQGKGRLDFRVSDLGFVQLKNIAEPVHAYLLEVDQAAEAKPAPGRAPTRPDPPRLSIVVLPFANLGGDPEQEYFVDGVTDTLTTDLSRMRGSFVIARNTAFTFKGKSIDVKTVGRELNVRYALEGSVQRRGDRMRVTVQLIDCESGSHLWAERFDKAVADFFDMQDEIVDRLASQLRAELIAFEAHRAENVRHPDAFDLYLQGMAWLNNIAEPSGRVRARDYFARALAADPANVGALIGLARVILDDLFGFASNERAAGLAEAEALLSRALSKDPQNAYAHVNLSFVKSSSNRPIEGIAEAEQALALNHFFLAAALAHLGEAERARAEAKIGINLHPAFTIDRFRVGAESDNPVFVTERQNVYEGLRKAGVPER
jgi:TolB-like protein/class 3 adenylate cyclase